MSYQVLARKWRPRSFETLVGQEHVVRALTHALEQNRLHHAYLLTGTRGVGKTTLARILAKALNCETGITAKPCGRCSSCTEIDAGRFIDLLEVDAATNTRVDEMRQLLENAVYTPTRGRFKVYVIDEVHMLSTSAFNAMLKTLEEPPEHVKFILATTDPQKIPVTVLSRCLQFNLKQMPAAAIAGHVREILKAEEVSFDEPATALIAQSARGSMRDALSLLDQAISFGGGRVDEAQVRAMLGSIDQGSLFEILEGLAANDPQRCLSVASAMESRSVSFDHALEELARLLHRVALTQSVPGSLSEDTADRARIEDLARRFDAETIQLYYQIAILGRRDLPLAPDEYAGFTMSLLRMHAFLPEPAEAGATRPAANAGVARPAAEAGAPPAAAKPGAARPAAEDAAPRPSAKAGITRPAANAGVARPAPDAGAAAEAGASHPAASEGSAPSEEGPAAGPSPAGPPGGRLAALDPQGWPDAVRGLRLSGFARQLAERAELVRADGRRLLLRLSPASRQLAGYRNKLRTAIEEQWGERTTLDIEIAETSERTVATEDARRDQSALAEARAAIESDPFVNDLISGFGATIESVQRKID